MHSPHIEQRLADLRVEQTHMAGMVRETQNTLGGVSKQVHFMEMRFLNLSERVTKNQGAFSAQVAELKSEMREIKASQKLIVEIAKMLIALSLVLLGMWQHIPEPLKGLLR